MTGRGNQQGSDAAGPADPGEPGRSRKVRRLALRVLLVQGLTLLLLWLLQAGFGIGAA